MYTPVPPRPEDDRPRQDATPAPVQHDDPDPDDAGQEVPIGPDVEAYVADCLARGSRPEEIRKQLLVLGYSPSDVDTLLLNARHQSPALAPANQGSGSGERNMLIGGLVCALGLVITFVSLSSSGGGVIAYGAIIWGAIQFFRGMAQSASGE